MMHRHVLRTLLLIGAIVLAIGSAFYHELYTLIPPWFWTAEETVMRILWIFLLRVVMRPFWTIITNALWLITFGYATRGRIQRWFSDPIARAYVRASGWWMLMHVYLRIVISLLFGVGFVFIVWLHTELLIFIPYAAMILKRIDLWLGDRLFDRLFAPVRIRWEALQRRHHLVRHALRPWKSFQTWIYAALEHEREERVEKRQRLRNIRIIEEMQENDGDLS